ncbi:T9SS type A sorting domain-containing protein [Chryseobacterium sp. 18068]|uniref:T9SS type A sorting domain-containing protein n=1 Tax=Chryseobacterium sp. 18068 TaxID=2681414 RepID=UPI0013580D6D|nr:T9SS type A sorting domain-containing protein [Chryseobacterium sp. 18068]
MKKIIGLVLINLSVLSFSQVMVNDNFNSLTLGNLVPNTMGSLGQNSYFANNGLVSDYQVVVIDAAHGNSAQFTNGIGNTDNDDRLAFKAITVVADPGNNIIRGSLEIFTGNNDGNGIIECVLYDSNKVGIIGIGYNYTSKKIVGRGRYAFISAPGNPTSFVTIERVSGPGNTAYPANTWVPVSFTYDKTTGAYEWTNPQGSFNYPDPSVVAVAGLTPTQYSLGSNVLSDNSVTNTAAIDNLVLTYTNTTLGTNEVSSTTNDISIYPNPVADFITVKSKKEIKSIEIYDSSGRKVSGNLNENKINVKSLLQGTYLITIETKNDKISKKFIKK